jgi:hypothetical protein
MAGDRGLAPGGWPDWRRGCAEGHLIER